MCSGSGWLVVSDTQNTVNPRVGSEQNFWLNYLTFECYYEYIFPRNLLNLQDEISAC